MSERQSPPNRPRRRRRWPLVLVAIAVVVLALVLIGAFAEFEYAYMPSMAKVLNPDRINQDIAFDVWGRSITTAEAAELMQTEEGRALLSPANGAVPIDADVLALGREAFYKETFRNEIFLTDITGMLDGPLTRWQFAKALLKLRGRGTTNLQVELADTVTVGGRTFEKGTLLNTGIDVPKGSWAPLGLKTRYARGRIQSGVTCALCHTAVDPLSGRVVEGAPNLDVNVGVILALAPNSASFFTNAQIPPLESLTQGSTRTVTTGDGRQIPLPDPAAIEEAVDAIFVRWPPGSFDSTVDLVGNPSQIPDSFTWRDHPYGWTGFALAGPFLGLSVLNNNVHALNSDGLSHGEGSEILFGFDKELFYGTVLQNAVVDRYRYTPDKGPRPSEFFDSVNPTPQAVGVNDLVELPTFPKGSLISPDGLFISSPGFRVWEQNNAVSAFQNTLIAAPAPAADAATLQRGRALFDRAGCADCHSGPGYTNHEILPRDEVGTQPSRATANSNVEGALVFPPLTYSWDTPVPIPADPRIIEVPLDHLDPDHIRLAYALEGSQGGFKVKGLVGLHWSPPYLHDGGVAVGPDSATQLGVPGTLLAGVLPDPANSLRALIDRGLRAQVVAANRAGGLAEVNVEGIGHDHWVDAPAGFSPSDQDALIAYLLSLDRPDTAP